MDQLVEEGIRDFVFVIGYLGEKIRLYVEQAYPEINKTFVLQNERQGSAHAIWVAKEEIRGSSEIIIVFGDTILDIDLKRVLQEEHSCFAVKKVDDPREFGVVEYDDDRFVKRAIEKPRIPKSDMALVGLYKIQEVEQFLDAIDHNVQNNIQTYGEYQLTDVLQRLIEEGVKFTTVPVNSWFDCGKKEILLRTNALLLDKEGYASSRLPNYDNSIIIHPVSIGKNCDISNSIIGPHVTIGDNVNIQHSIVKESIIGDYSTIDEVILTQSVVGSDAAIKGGSQSLNIGDNTEIDFS
ncbi:MAG: sugar phosphate nucleotidyltransferase [Bacteroidota bacterium]